MPVSWYLGQKKVELLTEEQMEQDNLYCVDQSVRHDTLGFFFFLLKRATCGVLTLDTR